MIFLAHSLISPSAGKVIAMKPHLVIETPANTDLYAPVAGMVKKNRENSVTTVEIYNEMVDKPVKMIGIIEIDKNVNIKVARGQCIGKIIKGPFIVSLDQISHFHTVNKGDQLSGGQSIVSYLLTNHSSHINHLVILTTPHETCLTPENAESYNDFALNRLSSLSRSDKNLPKEHTCDLFAPLLADKLKEYLEQKGRNVVDIRGNINRTSIDLNRIAGRETEFREKIRQEVRKFSLTASLSKPNLIYIIDCHSFPLEEKERYHFGTQETPKPEVTILYDDPIQVDLVKKLQALLAEKGLKVTAQPGRYNDIMDEFHETKYPDVTVIPLLLEIREDSSEEKLYLVAQAVDKWIDFVNRQIVE